MKTRFLLIVVSFIFLFIFSSNKVNLEKDRYQWYENILSDEVRDEMEYLDDQLLGTERSSYLIQGQVTDPAGNPLSGVSVKITDSSGEVLASATTNPKGFYYHPKQIKAQSYLKLTFSREQYSTGYKTISNLNPQFGYDMLLAPATTVKFNAGEIKTFKSPDNMAMLLLPASLMILKNGQKPRFPVTVKLSYISPQDGLKLMPGADMLAYFGKSSAIYPMLSSGAVNIEATDSAGNEVRVDLSKNSDVKTRLFVKPYNDFNEPLRMNLKGFTYDAAKSNLWQDLTEPLRKADMMMQALSGAADDYLLKYAADLTSRLNSKIQNRGNDLYVIYGCPNSGKPQTGTKIRLKKNLSAREIRENLQQLILSDLDNLSRQKDPDSSACPGLIIKGEGRSFQYDANFARVFDVEFSGKFSSAGSYSCKNPNDMFISRPYDLTAGFDYKPLESLRDSACFEAERAQWAEAMQIDKIDLVPFNLDVPKPAFPAQFEITENTGDGVLKAVFEIESQLGNFYTQRVIDSRKTGGKITVLLPEKNRVKVKIFGEPGQKTPTMIKEYNIPASENIYQWGKDKSKIVDKQGNEPAWKLMDKITF